jgi:hypothetical protein
LLAALVIVVGATLGTPAKSEAGPLRDRIRSGQPGPIMQWLQNRPLPLEVVAREAKLRRGRQ